MLLFTDSLIYIILIYLFFFKKSESQDLYRILREKIQSENRLSVGAGDVRSLFSAIEKGDHVTVRSMCMADRSLVGHLSVTFFLLSVLVIFTYLNLLFYYFILQSEREREGGGG